MICLPCKKNIQKENQELPWRCSKGADVFLGLSAGNILTPDMLLGMANDPIVLRWQIQIPKLNIISLYKKDLIMATGRSDYPNQVNNVLGFPYILEL
jgi:malate dehydrogenase (oxaloacetate-decarboxylating)(NADP+)